MGLDLTLAGLVLIMSVRGWFKGLVLQAIRLVGLVTCVYAADPVREVVKPRLIGYIPNIRPDLVDRLLWWSSAVVSYVVLVGVATLFVKMYRRKPFGEGEPARIDQSAGFLLGAAKGVIAVAFIATGIQKYALTYVQSFPLTARQIETSRALKWNEQYQPVAKIWATAPVQRFASQIQEKGLNPPAEGSASAPVASANRLPQLATPGELVPNLDQTVESLEAEIRKLDPSPSN